LKFIEVMTSIQSAVILLGEYNPLINVCGEPIITRQILRCQTIGIKKIFILGHFTPEVLDYLKLNHTTPDQSIIFQYTESPWQKVYSDKIGEDVLVISCEHFTDIEFFKNSALNIPEKDSVLMIGDANPTDISTARPRILLTKSGQPIEILERGKGEAVWMGLAILGEKCIMQLAHRKGEISQITFKQTSMISQYGNSRLIKATPLFWDRIDSSLIGSEISQEVLYHSNTNRNFMDIWESGISQAITKFCNFNKSAILPIYILLFLSSGIGGWLLNFRSMGYGLLGLCLTLLGLLLGRTIQEISEMHYIQKIKMTGSQIVAARVSALGIFTGLLQQSSASDFQNVDNKLTFLAIAMLFVVSYVEASKYMVTNKLEQAPVKYELASKWLKNTLHILNLHWIWYTFPVLYAFNLFPEYFSLLIIEIYFLYLISLLQLPTQKNTIHEILDEYN